MLKSKNYQQVLKIFYEYACQIENKIVMQTITPQIAQRYQYFLL